MARLAAQNGAVVHSKPVAMAIVAWVHVAMASVAPVPRVAAMVSAVLGSVATAFVVRKANLVAVANAVPPELAAVGNAALATILAADKSVVRTHPTNAVYCQPGSKRVAAKEGAAESLALPRACAVAKVQHVAKALAAAKLEIHAKPEGAAVLMAAFAATLAVAPQKSASMVLAWTPPRRVPRRS